MADYDAGPSGESMRVRAETADEEGELAMTRRDAAQQAVDRLRAISLGGSIGVFDVVLRRVIEEVMAEREKPLIEMMRQLEWSGSDWPGDDEPGGSPISACPSCRAYLLHGEHDNDCKLAAFLKEYEQ